VIARRALPALLAVLGLASIALAAACDGGDDPAPTPQPATATSTSTSTATATATSTPTPSPTPYNGAVMRLRIPRFGVDAPIEELAINARGELDTPHRENTDVGWYYIYDKPGRVNPENTGWFDFGVYKQPGFRGNAVFSAHIYYHSIPAPFQRLQQTVPGDEVSVVMEDGREYHYRVLSRTSYNRDTIPMGEIIWPSTKPAEKEWVTLISCGGQLDSTGQEYVDRIVVVAERTDGEG
jgi:hypothetical protein